MKLSDNERYEITVVNHYNVFPFNHGGTLAIRGLYHALSKWFDINIITFVPCEADYYESIVPISKCIRVHTIVLSEKMSAKQKVMYEELGMNKDTFIDSTPAVIRWYHQQTDIIEQVRLIAKDSILVVAEHAYTWRIIHKACQDKHLWYRAQNVEYDYKYATYGKMPCREQVVSETYEIERECCMGCERIMTISSEDIDRFMEVYSFDQKIRSRFMAIHLGYDYDPHRYRAPKDRKQSDSNGNFSGFFISSNMLSAQIAAKKCIDAVREIPRLKLYIAGRVCDSLLNISIPQNVELLGVISETEKAYYLKNCDFALNPVESGAGVNVKMLEYFAYEIPVVSTEYGARGIDILPGREYFPMNMGDIAGSIGEFLAWDIDRKTALTKNAKTKLEEDYSWENIACKIKDVICGLYDLKELMEASEDEIRLFPVEEKEDYKIQQPVFIRGAGHFGHKCFLHLKEMGVQPKAFIDNDHTKTGGCVMGIPVISQEDFLKKDTGGMVIIAINSWPDVASEMINNGLPMDRLVIAFLGTKLYHIGSQMGNHPAYYSPEKIKDRLMRKVLEQENSGV